MWKQVVVAKCEIPFQHLLGGTEENCKEPYSIIDLLRTNYITFFLNII
jgi:hypothetical protein